jgi:hypothetical protein
MDLQGGVGEMEACFGTFGDIVNLGARYVHSLGRCTIGSEIFWGHPMELLGDLGQIEACFSLFRG